MFDTLCTLKTIVSTTINLPLRWTTTCITTSKIAGFSNPLNRSHILHFKYQQLMKTMAVLASNFPDCHVPYHYHSSQTQAVRVSQSQWMHAANNGIQILGAVILRFSETSPNGYVLETRQLTFVITDSDRIFLS